MYSWCMFMISAKFYLIINITEITVEIEPPAHSRKELLLEFKDGEDSKMDGRGMEIYLNKQCIVYMYILM